MKYLPKLLLPGICSFLSIGRYITSLFRFCRLFHICKAFYGFCKAGDCLIYVPVLDPVTDTVVDMSFQNNLPDTVKGRLGRIDLRENILTWNILIDHPVNRLHLPDDLFQTSVKIVGIHTLSHL